MSSGSKSPGQKNDRNSSMEVEVEGSRKLNQSCSKVLEVYLEEISSRLGLCEICGKTVWLQQLTEHYNRMHAKDCTDKNTTRTRSMKEKKLESPQSWPPKGIKLCRRYTLVPNVLVMPIEIEPRCDGILRPDSESKLTAGISRPNPEGQLLTAEISRPNPEAQLTTGILRPEPVAKLTAGISLPNPERKLTAWMSRPDSEAKLTTGTMNVSLSNEEGFPANSAIDQKLDRPKTKRKHRKRYKSAKGVKKGRKYYLCFLCQKTFKNRVPHLVHLMCDHVNKSSDSEPFIIPFKRKRDIFKCKREIMLSKYKIKHAQKRSQSKPPSVKVKRDKGSKSKTRRVKRGTQTQPPSVKVNLENVSKSKSKTKHAKRATQTQLLPQPLNPNSNTTVSGGINRESSVFPKPLGPTISSAYNVIKMHPPTIKLVDFGLRVKIPCKWCEVDVAISKMAEHIETTHIKDTQTKCELCDHTAPTLLLLRQHVKEHSILNPLVCTVCGKHFQTVNNLRLHRYSHKASPTRPRLQRQCFCCKT